MHPPTRKLSVSCVTYVQSCARDAGAGVPDVCLVLDTLVCPGGVPVGVPLCPDDVLASVPVVTGRSHAPRKSSCQRRF